VDKIETAQQVSFNCEAQCLNITTTGHLKVHELFNYTLTLSSSQLKNRTNCLTLEGNFLTCKYIHAYWTADFVVTDYVPAVGFVPRIVTGYSCIRAVRRINLEMRSD